VYCSFDRMRTKTCASCAQRAIELSAQKTVWPRRANKQTGNHSLGPVPKAFRARSIERIRAVELRGWPVVPAAGAGTPASIAVTCCILSRPILTNREFVRFLIHQAVGAYCAIFRPVLSRMCFRCRRRSD
jgi:hypothetical protein